MSVKKRFVNKKGQVTAFIIIAILVIALAVLAYLFFPKLKSTVETKTQSPNEYIQTCMSQEISNILKNLSLNGGSVNSEKGNSYFYLGNNVEYLCYTNQYYIPCVIQQPLLIQHIESETKNNIQDDVNSCFVSLVANYKNNGYDTSLKYPTTDIKVELLPQRVVVSFNNVLTITKGESQTFSNFSVVLNTNIYQEATIANSIIGWEEELGNAPVSSYMDWYPNLKIEKISETDGSKIYVIIDRDFGDKFQFASRSMVLPAGY